jgi:hypothetical protein
MINEPNLLDYLSAFGSIATPVLVLILTAIGWNVRTRLQRRQELEDRLREDRISIYNALLEPFIMLFMTDTAWRSDPKNKNKDKGEIATRKMLSLEYRQTAFRLSLIGSDAVVKAYNDLLQYFYQRSDPESPPDPSDLKKMMSLLGALLLEIRKSMGNEATKLDNWSMLEWFITDARQYRGL